MNIRRDVVINAFHQLYYHSGANNTTYRGIPIIKSPLDMWVYQQLVWELQPELVIETGTYMGGSALFLADQCDLNGRGRVISIDIEPRENRPPHPRVEYVLSSSLDKPLLERLTQVVGGISGHTMVILDSDHSMPHVLNECRAFAGFVTPGSYLVVEDTNVNGHPVFPGHGPGPWEAASTFLAERPDFQVDEAREPFLLSMNPRGYLRKGR